MPIIPNIIRPLFHLSAVTVHYVTVHYVTVHYVTVHYVTVHYVTVHYVTVHYVTVTEEYRFWELRCNISVVIIYQFSIDFD